MRAAFAWLTVGLLLFFGFGLEVSPLNRPVLVEVGVGLAVACFIVAFSVAALNPPGLPRDTRKKCKPGCVECIKHNHPDEYRAWGGGR